ncbi:aldehyde dehydrogenase [Bacillus sp. OK048]|uniref:aldehyde dehydrogenase n=1 Tax=Bacillus sp. OK048 TaxID=1882761 RepID=UPI0008845A05|nr:aldehyde dehydrogenase [Bacillus sp. OK048]SDL95618.1 aldehyde dehydrogenase (NAD+) [Bacillus sp. OK048]
MEKSNTIQQYQMYIGGEFVDAISGAVIESTNPASGQVWALIPRGQKEDVDRACQEAKQCFESKEWKSISPAQRGRLLRQLAEAIADNAEHLAKIETQDNGKLYKEMLAQLKLIPSWFEYYAGLTDKLQGSVIPLERESLFNYTMKVPLGVIACITPWNSPLLNATWKMAPALAAGNTIVLKPSEYTSASSLEFAKVFHEVGFPTGSLNVVTGYGSEIGEHISKNLQVNKVAFTGGTATGRKVAMSVASNLARVTLELGGKSPNIVFADADLEAAEAGVLAGIFAASGQTCVAGSRLYVERRIMDDFVDRLVKRANAIKIGDPMDPVTQMGPAATPEQLNKIENYVKIAIDEGASVVAGGKRPEAPELENGLFFTPTILTNVNNSMRICQEEVFGPVLCVIPFDSEKEVVELANDSEFGLAAGIWTNDVKRSHRMARAIESGIVWINTYRTSTPNSPFGGFKNSGIGKENGIEAIYDYMQTKSVIMELSNEISDPFNFRS